MTTSDKALWRHHLSWSISSGLGQNPKDPGQVDPSWPCRVDPLGLTGCWSGFGSASSVQHDWPTRSGYGPGLDWLICNFTFRALLGPISDPNHKIRDVNGNPKLDQRNWPREKTKSMMGQPDLSIQVRTGKIHNVLFRLNKSWQLNRIQ